MRRIWIDPKLTDEEILELLTSDDVQKHYGPGPHPGTRTDQSVHGGGGFQPQLSDRIFGDAPPTPHTKLKFTTQYQEELYGLGPAGQETYTEEGRNFGVNTRRALRITPLTDEDKLAIRHAVEAFEQEFGVDALPDEIEFQVARSFDGSMAWVEPLNDPDIIFINDVVWSDEFEMKNWAAGLMDAPWNSAPGDMVKELLESSEVDPFASDFTLRITTVYHELAHIATKHQGWALNWPDGLPHYNPPWFDSEVPAGDPSLPSAYAATSPAEFLAEALTDAWVNGDEAAPISIETREIFKELVGGK